MAAGRYYVKVTPAGTDLADQTKEVQVTTGISVRSSDTEYVEFTLNFKKKSDAPTQKAEAVFAQEVPPEAKKLLEQAADDVKRDQQKGIEEIEQALAIFPNYFDALSLAGQQYILIKNYEKAYPYLIKAVDINPRSYSVYYRLGYAFFQLKQYKAAVEAARASTILIPGSVDGQLLYGTTLRITGNFPEAEKVLLKADLIAKGADIETHRQLALLYNRLNRDQDAIDQLEKILALNPSASDKDEVGKVIEQIRARIKRKTGATTPFSSFR